MFHKNKLGSIIRSTGTVFYSLLFLNSRRGFHGLKYVYSVISVIVDSLPGNTKHWESTRSWTARVRLVHSWAECISTKDIQDSHKRHTGWLRSVGSIKKVSFAEYRLFYRTLLQKRPIILSILLTEATPYRIHPSESPVRVLYVFCGDTLVEIQGSLMDVCGSFAAMQGRMRYTSDSRLLKIINLLCRI